MSTKPGSLLERSAAQNEAVSHAFVLTHALYALFSLCHSKPLYRTQLNADLEFGSSMLYKEGQGETSTKRSKSTENYSTVNKTNRD